MRKRHRNHGKGCFIVLLEGIIFIIAIMTVSMFLHGGDLFRGMYNIGKERISNIPGFEALSSGNDKAMINDDEEFVDFVNEKLQSGCKKFSFKTEDLDEEFIRNINTRIEAFYGSCANYTTTDYGRYREVEMTCKLTNAYYAERYLINQEEIPENREDAKALAKRCLEILDDEELNDLSEYRKEKYFHDYIVKNTVYTTEGDRDLLSSPEGPLLHGKGVCSGYARAMKLLCDLSAVRCRTIVGVAGGEDHEWNMVQINDEWYHVDVTWDDPVPDQKYPMYAYLNLTDEAMAIDHAWKKKYYPDAVQTDYDYYRLNEACFEDYDEFRDYMEEILQDQPKDVRVMVGDYSKKNYSEDRLSFLFRESGASRYGFVTCGPVGRTEIYFSFHY